MEFCLLVKLLWVKSVCSLWSMLVFVLFYFSFRVCLLSTLLICITFWRIFLVLFLAILSTTQPICKEDINGLTTLWEPCLIPFPITFTIPNANTFRCSHTSSVGKHILPRLEFDFQQWRKLYSSQVVTKLVSLDHGDSKLIVLDCP